MQSQRTYRLKRNRPKEPLGLVLVSGDKTRDGRYKSYYVKKVNRDTLGWRAGILAGDRIIKVDNCDLWRMTPQESVARIKEKSVILLTVVRETGGNASAKANHSHIYDEIMYSDLSQQNLSQHALSQPLPGLSFTGPGLLAHGFSQYDENYPPAPPPMDFGKYAPAAQQLKPLTDNEDSDHKPQRHLRPISPAAHLTRRTASTSGLGERTSKDSGLSSGSSDSRNHAPKQMDPQPAVTSTARLTAQEPATAQASLITHTQDLDRDINARKSYRTEREMVRTFLKNQRRNSPAPQEPVPANQPMRSRNCRIVGNYELEDIYLEKNGTSQLGITLGYDSSAAHGSCLYVCEIVSGGLAASDGRLRTGDIIKRVNGFQVYDPEEAILLFLEQDQDITLSVARKIKMPSKLRPRAETDLDYLESTLLRDGHSMRKVDSCGSLDSHTHHDYATLEPPSDRIDEPIALQEPSRRSRDLSSLHTNSQVNVHESWKLQEDDPFEDDPYHTRRSSTPSRTTKHSPLSSSRQVMGSSPNLLRPTHGPRQTSLGLSKCASGSNLLSTNPVTSHNGRRRTSSQDRPTSSTPDSKHYRPLGGVVRNQRKRSTPSPVGTPITPLDHEPRIMVPPSPTQVPPSFRGLAHEIRRLPNRFENNSLLDPSTAATHIRRESLV